MSSTFQIRACQPSDARAIESLYRAAFPDEDLVPLVTELSSQTSGVITLVGVRTPDVVGHVVLTRCSVEPDGTSAALLGPLAVDAASRNQGIGGALVRRGLTEAAGQGVQCVLVLGDPGYYGQFGFAEERRVAPPYLLPEEWRSAWQSVDLGSEPGRIEGRLSVPAPWRQPHLWGRDT